MKTIIPRGQAAPLQKDDIEAIWDKVASNYNAAAIDGHDFHANIRVMLDAVGDPAGRSFCEVGSGSGTTSAALAEMGAEITLVDLSPKALAFARAHFERSGLRAEYCLENGLGMSFPDNTFDV